MNDYDLGFPRQFASKAIISIATRKTTKQEIIKEIYEEYLLTLYDIFQDKEMTDYFEKESKLYEMIGKRSVSLCYEMLKKIMSEYKNGEISETTFDLFVTSLDGFLEYVNIVIGETEAKK